MFCAKRCASLLTGMFIVEFVISFVKEISARPTVWEVDQTTPLNMFL